MIEGTIKRLVEDAALRGDLRAAARDADPVSGLTHRHYKYPARFSPKFVASVIHAFSRPGDLVLDPYMGGGTTILEAQVADRRTVGCDINSLAVFVAKVKCTTLGAKERAEVEKWVSTTAPRLSYRDQIGCRDVICAERTKNLDLPRARALKKLIALALESLRPLSSPQSEAFVRCAILNTAQWALNGRRRSTPLTEFRERLIENVLEMLSGTARLEEVMATFREPRVPTLIHRSAEHLALEEPFRNGEKADLVVTSPPYPGVHVLYHRWQVDGRRETPAPYWIANCLDGEGSAFYNFGGRHQAAHEDYFAASLRTLRSIRSVMKKGAAFVQMVAFSNPRPQLRKYLENMAAAGFAELVTESNRAVRTWRDVPGRSWHANLQGRTKSSREVVLTHVAI